MQHIAKPIWFRSILAETSRTVEFFYPKYYNKFSDGRPEGGGSDGCPEGGGSDGRPEGGFNGV